MRWAVCTPNRNDYKCRLAVHIVNTIDNPPVLINIDRRATPTTKVHIHYVLVVHLRHHRQLDDYAIQSMKVVLASLS